MIDNPLSSKQQMQLQVLKDFCDRVEISTREEDHAWRFQGTRSGEIVVDVKRGKFESAAAAFRHAYLKIEPHFKGDKP